MLALTYLFAVVILEGVLSLTYRRLILSGGLIDDESTELPGESDPMAEAGVCRLASRSTLFDRDVQG